MRAPIELFESLNRVLKRSILHQEYEQDFKPIVEELLSVVSSYEAQRKPYFKTFWVQGENSRTFTSDREHANLVSIEMRRGHYTQEWFFKWPEERAKCDKLESMLTWAMDFGEKTRAAQVSSTLSQLIR